MMEGRSPMTLADTRPPQKPLIEVDSSSQAFPTDQWVTLSWEEFVAISEDPQSEKWACYYYNHQMRIETMGIGANHAIENTILTLAIGLFCMLKDIPNVGLTNASYFKGESRGAQPDMSYYLGEDNMTAIPDGNSLIDLNIFSAPALAIEIAATSLKDDLGLKRLLYEELGIQEYWVVNAETKEIFAFEILAGGGSRRITESIVLPGLALKTIETALIERKTPENRQIMANLMKEFAA